MLHRSIITISIFAILLTALVSFAVPASATDPIKFKPAVPIPGMTIPTEGIDITPTTVGEYIKTIYTFSVYAGSILAVVVLMIGGFIWLTAGGNVSQVGQARTYISGAISGFVLLLLSWTILQMVNPRLVEFKPIVVNEVIGVPLPLSVQSCCVCSKGSGAVYQCQPEVFSKDSGGGVCVCGGNNEAAFSVSDEASCVASGSDCVFGQSPYRTTTAAAEVCRSGRGLGPEWTCSIDNRSCDIINECLERSQLRRFGPCRLDTICDQAAGYTCNFAYDCSNSKFGTLAKYAVGSSGTGCCRLKSVVGDFCTFDEDCQSGNCAFLGLNPFVGVCK